MKDKFKSTVLFEAERLGGTMKNKFKSMIPFVVLAALLLAPLYGCKAPAPTPTPTKVAVEPTPTPALTPTGVLEPIKVGNSLVMTGPKAKFGKYHIDGEKMALEEIEAEGWIRKGPLKGRPIEMIYVDDEAKPELAIANVEKLITIDKVAMIEGGWSSSTVYAEAGVCEKYGIPFFCAYGAADKISGSGFKWTFRLCCPASEYDASLRDFFEKVVKPKTMVILHENTLFGESTSKAMVKWCEDHGVKVLMKEPYEAGSLDFRPLLTKAKALEPDVFYAVSYLADATLIIKQARELGVHPKLFCGSAAGWGVEDFIKGAGVATEYTVSSILWAPDVKYPGAKEFAEKFKKKYGYEANYHACAGYASMYALREVLETTKSLDPEDLWVAMRNLDIMTPYGHITFGDWDGMFMRFTNQPKIDPLVRQVQNGKFVTIWPKEYAAADYIYPLPFEKWIEGKLAGE